MPLCSEVVGALKHYSNTFTHEWWDTVAHILQTLWGIKTLFSLIISLSHPLLLPANEVVEGYVFTGRSQSLSREGLFPGGLCPGVSVQGGLCPGGLCPGGLCPGGSLSGGPCHIDPSVW